MRAVSPKVFLIGKPQIVESETREWLDHIGAGGYRLHEGRTPGEAMISLCGKRCYMSFDKELNPNLSRVREDMRDFVHNVLKVGHGSVVSHAHYSFAIEGISRVCTAELNRHRVGSQRLEGLDDEPDISEGSQRFIRFTDIPYVVPRSLLPDPADSPEVSLKKTATRKVFEDAFCQAEDNYAKLLSVWEEELDQKSSFRGKKAVTSMMRRVIPSGVASGGVWTYSMRALYAVFNQRCAADAEEEILDVGCQMLEKMMEHEPLFFGVFEKGPDGCWKSPYGKV